MRGEQGSAVLVTVLLLPLFALVLAAAVDLGSLRISATRVRAAADLAALVAVDDQDEDAMSRGEPLRLSADAEDVARDYLARNLVVLGSALAADARQIAAQASIAVFSSGDVDPLDGTRYTHPTVRVRADVPLQTGALRALIGSVVPVRAHAAAAAR